MLGRNATRPLGMTSSRLMSPYSALPMGRMQQYLSIASHNRLASSAGSGSRQSGGDPRDASTQKRSLHLGSDLTLLGASGSAQQQQQQPIHTSCAGLDQDRHAPPHPQQTDQQRSQQQDQLHLATEASDRELMGLEGQSTMGATDNTDDVKAAVKKASTGSNGTGVGGGSNVSFNYLLAASWHPKSRKQPAKAEKSLSSEGASDGKEEGEEKTQWWKQKKIRPGKVDAGEDAFFHVSTPSRVALGVADGVGGWSNSGVDPALFAWALMDNAEAVAKLTDSKSKNGKTPLDAQTILDGAYSELIKSGKVKAGSSTACILSLCKTTGVLRASNLGDSAYLLIRNNRCLFESPSQTHGWNCPYQLMVLPPSYNANAYVKNVPGDAAQTNHQLKDGDVIVLATDGFWDNVFTKETIKLVKEELGDVIQMVRKKGEKGSLYESGGAGDGEDIVGKVRALSQTLTNTARSNSLSSKMLTPFSKSAGYRSGGKVDDITVIVTLVRALPSMEK